MSIQFVEPDEISIQAQIPVCEANIERYMAQGVNVEELETLYKDTYNRISLLTDRNKKARELLTLKVERKKIDRILELQEENLILYGN